MAKIRAWFVQRVPAEELKRRSEFALELDCCNASVARVEGSFPTAEEMIREDLVAAGLEPASYEFQLHRTIVTRAAREALGK